MMGLYYELYECSWKLQQCSRRENANVRRRIAKVCRELHAIREYVMNIAKHVDFVKCDTVSLSRYFSNPNRYRVLCAGCRKDITLVGGWVFPQEPKKYYCTECQCAKFNEGIGRSEKESPCS